MCPKLNRKEIHGRCSVGFLEAHLKKGVATRTGAECPAVPPAKKSRRGLGCDNGFITPEDYDYSKPTSENYREDMGYGMGIALGV